MPYVSIRVAGTLSKEQKQNISKGVTEVISKEANNQQIGCYITKATWSTMAQQQQ